VFDDHCCGAGQRRGNLDQIFCRYQPCEATECCLRKRCTQHTCKAEGWVKKERASSIRCKNYSGCLDEECCASTAPHALRTTCDSFECPAATHLHISEAMFKPCGGVDEILCSVDSCCQPKRTTAQLAGTCSLFKCPGDYTQRPGGGSRYCSTTGDGDKCDFCKMQCVQIMDRDKDLLGYLIPVNNTRTEAEDQAAIDARLGDYRARCIDECSLNYCCQIAPKTCATHTCIPSTLVKRPGSDTMACQTEQQREDTPLGEILNAECTTEHCCYDPAAAAQCESLDSCSKCTQERDCHFCRNTLNQKFGQYVCLSLATACAPSVNGGLTADMWDVGYQQSRYCPLINADGTPDEATEYRDEDGRIGQRGVTEKGTNGASRAGCSNAAGVTAVLIAIVAVVREIDSW
jgi:hypothetical protein